MRSVSNASSSSRSVHLYLATPRRQRRTLGHSGFDNHVLRKAATTLGGVSGRSWRLNRRGPAVTSVRACGSAFIQKRSAARSPQTKGRDVSPKNGPHVSVFTWKGMVGDEGFEPSTR
jgi:hypothetical protein